jgi:hypothetical protein
MGLTLEIDQRLQRAGLVAYFNAHQEEWKAAAQDAYDYAKKQFSGEAVRQDDIAKPLRMFVEIHKGLRDYLDGHKLSQKYWIDFFNALVIDRTWNGLTK